MLMLNIPIKPLYKELKFGIIELRKPGSREILSARLEETVAERVNSRRGGATRRLVQLVDDIHQTFVHWATRATDAALPILFRSAALSCRRYWTHKKKDAAWRADRLPAYQ